MDWQNLSWRDIQAIGADLAERYPEINYLTVSPEKLAALIDAPTVPEDHILSAIATAWLDAAEGEDDR
jgi:Fe-S-cluster formation regulator IscX/YfhJ